MKKKRPVVFLDRDGTMLYDRPGYYLRTPDKLRLYPFTAKALKLLSEFNQEGALNSVPFDSVWNMINAVARSAE